MKRRLNWGGLLRWCNREKLRILVIILTVLVAWAISTWATPYRETTQTQFLEVSRAHASQLRAEVVEVQGAAGKAKVLDGPQRDQVLPIVFYGVTPTVGSTVLISSDTTTDTPNSVSQLWRIPALVWLVAFMIVLVVLVGGRRGVMSLLGLAMSIGVIVWYIIPQVMEGANALLVSSVGAFAIATVSIIVAHSLRWRTFVALVSIYAILVVVLLLAWLAGQAAGLTGVYDETSSLLKYSGQPLPVDLYGILIGGIVIASLGVLDDVVTTQVAAVDELHQAKPHALWQELFNRGMSVGREHLSALINTLALAYIGVALPTILVFSHTIANQQQQLLTMFNYEYIAVEIIRTAISSMGIIIAIPFSTALAVAMIVKRQQLMLLAQRILRRNR